jgi:3-methyladenine DNA glycosylase AlkD
MIADPNKMTEEQIEAWADDLDNYPLTDALVGLVGRSSYAQAKAEEWTRSDEEWRGAAGWQLLGGLAMHDNSLPDEYFERYLDIVERDIHSRKNRVRYSMNTTLICIGIRNPDLQEKAIAVAREIGTVDVDHGETNCETPAAEAYILKTVARRQAKGQ